MSGGHDGHSGGGGRVELWAVQTGPLGVVVTDGSGALLYRSDRDGNAPPVSTCTGMCAATWPPVLVDPGQSPSLLGVEESVVGTLVRDDGITQVTLAGWPLYRHNADTFGLGDAAANGADGVEEQQGDQHPGGVWAARSRPVSVTRGDRP